MLRIGPLEFDSPVILAPLAGYSDLPFRLLCRRYGATFCVSEMISCHGLVYQQQNSLKMLRSVPQERPVSFQLFGAEPEIMAEAAQILASYNPDMIDINMGCPVKKVTRKGAGAALMGQPERAAAIVSAVVDAVDIPVTVKIRSGTDYRNLNGVEFAKMLEDCGAAAITVHARTWSQQFSGRIDPEVIKRVKAAVAIPVIGNGDLQSLDDGRKMRAATRCDGVMIGRGALGNPWIFGDRVRPHSLAAISETAMEHLDLMEQHLPAARILGYVKNQMSRYYKGLPGASLLRQQIFATPTLEALKELLRSTEPTGSTEPHGAKQRAV